MTEIERLQMNANQANSDFVAIKNEIVASGIEISVGTRTAEYANKVKEVYEAGKKAQYNEFWDNQLDGGKRTIFDLAFAGIGWNDKTFKPPIKIKPKNSNTYMMFARTGVTSLTFEMLDVSDVIELQYSFYLSYALRSVEIDIRSCKKLTYTFQMSYALEYVHIKNISSDCIFTQTFYNTDNLKELITEGTIGQNGLNIQWSTKLSKASWQNIISVLSSTTTGLSITGSLASVNKAFETSEGANDGSTSEEWLNLIATKSNWTINLV